MARRKKSHVLNDVLDLLALLPWWVCVALAPLGYWGLHGLAVPLQPSDMVVAPSPGLAGAMAQQAILHGLALAGQYVVPLLCLTAAAMSAWRRRQRRNLLGGVAQAHEATALQGMSWHEFELLVGEAFRQQGFRVTERGGQGPDGGVDLVLARGSETFFVQCKQWRARTVGVTTVRELYGAMAAAGATGGFVVTSGRFTADAQAFAQGRDVTLIDGSRLFAMVQQARQANGAAQRVQDHPASVGPDRTRPSPAPTPSPVPPDPQGGTAAPQCPRCTAPMQLRTARQGAHAGTTFWGCSTYPGCRGTRTAAPASRGPDLDRC